MQKKRRKETKNRWDFKKNRFNPIIPIIILNVTN